MAYYEYKIPITDQEKKDLAIALLSDLGVFGFEETDAELIGFSKEELDEKELKEIIQLLSTSYSKSTVQEKNWNEIWEAGFQPITVWNNNHESVFAYVRADFHEASSAAQYDLIITPKMSFGTGHHATTYGMISYMRKIKFEGLHVVDFGTGTGLLAILAEKMGATKVLATDNDPWCIRSAEENFLVNGCVRVELKESDHFEKMQQNDVILANINLNIIKANLSIIVSACHEATIILFSGILIQNETEILNALHEFNIEETEVIKNDGWLIIAAKRGRQIATLTASS